MSSRSISYWKERLFTLKLELKTKTNSCDKRWGNIICCLIMNMWMSCITTNSLIFPPHESEENPFYVFLLSPKFMSVQVNFPTVFLCSLDPTISLMEGSSNIVVRILKCTSLHNLFHVLLWSQPQKTLTKV